MASLEPTSGAPPDREIGEAEFAELLRQESVVLFRTLGRLEGGPIGRNLFGDLGHDCHELESFLDDHGARANRAFATLTELVASLRSLANSGFALAHVRSRLDSYGATTWGASEAVVREAVQDSGRFVEEACLALGGRLREEAQALDCLPPEVSSRSIGQAPPEKRRLPHDIGEDEAVDDPQRVAELVARYLQGADVLSDLSVEVLEGEDDLRRFVEAKCREEQARVYEATIHNLQSTYDTYIKNTALEASDQRLAHLRGHASAALHLLEGLTHLAHFHERHENEKGARRAATVIAELVPKRDVFAVMVNRMLLAASQVLERGRPVAESLLNDFTRVRELLVGLPDGASLHARPVALLVGIVNHFGTPVEFEVDGRRCNAGSILEVLMAVGSHAEATEFTFRGDERPLEHIALLFEHGLGERDGGDLPEALSYLRPS